MHARLVLPHQLFDEQRTVGADLLVLVEPDLFFRQFAFHSHKLVLHRASMRRFAAEVAKAGRATAYVETLADRDTDAQLADLLRERGATRLSWFDVVDDWLDRDLRAVAAGLGIEPEVEETPAFLTSDAEVRAQLAPKRGSRPRMATFYAWQRRRLDVLVEAGEPAGGRWSFDEENREPYPRGGLDVPPLPTVRRDAHVRDAIAWVAAEFPDNPGDPAAFAWPTSRAQAKRWLERFVADRLAGFGPHEDAIAADEPFLFHSTLSPLINLGLLSPREVLDAALAAEDVPLASLEGFVRQVIGWREYIRGVYVTRGRRLRTGNRLRLARDLEPGWWDGTTGLHPVDVVVRRVLEHGYAHHIERLMILGNAMLLLRTDPDEVYEWFMAMFVDAYDWVMVPNVYAMSQFAAAEAVTTKPYVSGSNYVLRMSNFSKRDGERDAEGRSWADAWDALYWQFVDDHRDGFAANPRTSMTVRTLDKMKGARRRELADLAAEWLGR
ncbi:cryptochrome/photolyase family protein [Nocardioides sp. ChNu-153]|uniref:cryptochrome/photolyase family protein n=1 Tax=Nocardioides sp. ChNu-153 TaxID=2779364 RepID=UPI00264C32B0|nr:cryptochrome/photolyase family protein [Nocardioides sp. ChNu-153]MDN7121084.1 cryptochrome/photolyase family protein [Nocardioides sp. ChNu-153]